jgi:hypothetical protein
MIGEGFFFFKLTPGSPPRPPDPAIAPELTLLVGPATATPAAPSSKM